MERKYFIIWATLLINLLFSFSKHSGHLTFYARCQNYFIRSSLLISSKTGGIGAFLYNDSLSILTAV
jgi:hypothetical protein